MTIKKHELKKMNELLQSGSTVVKISEMYPQYNYWEIYWEVEYYSFVGRKRIITNRIRTLVESRNLKKRESLAKEVNKLITDLLYEPLKTNSAKLQEIDRTLRK
ncbi:MAG: hypothetical protein ACR2P9_05670 [Gammaproteobacteria bacterium]